MRDKRRFRNKGLNKNKKEILKKYMGRASHPNMDLNKVREHIRYKNGSYKYRKAVINKNIAYVYNRRPNEKEGKLKIIKPLYKGDLIEVVYCIDNWFSVFIENELGFTEIGFIDGDFIDLI